MDTSQAAKSFRGLRLRHRGRIGLPQRGLAVRMGSSRRTLQDWESGGGYPSTERLRALITALLASGGLTVGHEKEEVEDLWAAVLRQSPRMRTPFDEVWLTRLLADRAAPAPVPELAGYMFPAAPGMSAAERSAVERRAAWGEAPDLLGLVNRAEDFAPFRRWILQAHCRLLEALGIGASAQP